MKKILVVEDDPIIMNLIVILLEREGYTVAQATSAEEGISLAHAGPPDLILMDVALPGLDGLEATRILKDAEATHACARDRPDRAGPQGGRGRALRAGCDGFIPKPLSTRAFLEQVSGFLGDQGRRGKG